MTDKNTDRDPIILIDGSSYLYRAYHALPPLESSKGQPTGAIRGVVSMIKRILVDHSESPVVVVFDAKGKTFRNEMYKEYKANRPPMPEDLVSQIEPIHEIIKHMGIQLIVKTGVEADDVIGTLAEQATKQNLFAVISTGDKDMTQLVNNRVKVVNTMSGELLDSKGVKKKFGVGPDLIIDYLALIGDTSDNVPGVEKVGPKTAVKWLEEYKNLDGIIENCESIKGKVGENLRSSIEQLRLSKELVTIKKDVELELSINDFKVKDPNQEKLNEIFTELEFKTWLEEENTSKETEEIPTNYELINTESSLKKLIQKIKKAPVVSVDTETNGLQYMDVDLVGVSISTALGEGAYIPLSHAEEGQDQLDLDFVIKSLKPVLEDSKTKLIGQNIKFDMNILSRYGIDIKNIESDTMLMSYVLNSTATRHNLDALSRYYLNHKTISFEEVAGKGAKQITFDQVPVSKAVDYASEDADITLRLFQKLEPLLKLEPTLENLLKEIEIPLIKILSKTESAGTFLNKKVLEAQSKNLSERIERLEEMAYEVAGEEFNLSSPKQLQEIFFEKLGYPVIKKTPGGQPSTAENVLQELSQSYDLPKIILEHRTLSKLKSTYTDKLPNQISSNTGRIHTSFHQAVTTTGRLSSSDPNLQNIPIRTEDGRRIRQAFVSKKGYKLISADYSQIELRVMAHLSKDKGLIEAFNKKEDIHSRTASEVFEVPLEEIDEDQRRSAKAINFGLIYGISAFGLSNQLKISRNLAAEYMDIYFTRYPGVREFMEKTKEFAKKRGYVETLYGRRLYLPEINQGNAIRRQAAERAAINAPVQGTAADIMKKAMILVDGALEESKLDAKMILQVHDELILETLESDCDKTKELLVKNMEKAAELEISLEVDVGMGNNWDQAH